ncbi:hypothetical protein LguiB_033788 [Lonicera macranthoides]
MKPSNTSLLTFLFICAFSFSWAALADTHNDFLQCFSSYSQNFTSISSLIYTPNNSSYRTIFLSSAQNPRTFASASTSPLAIITPSYESQIREIIHCSKLHGIEIRVRSGGHDYEVDENLFIRLYVSSANSSENGNKIIVVSFVSLFLGGIETLLPIMQESFPELGLLREDCTEMSWIESALYMAQFPRGSPLSVLRNRTLQDRISFKGKSDFVKEPISEKGLEGIWERLYEQVRSSALHFTPYGGRMSEISESELPFPHRSGNIYMIHYAVLWREEGPKTQNLLSWIRRLYNYMGRYVSRSPRAAYMNYKDLDLGVNNKGNTSYTQASIWGTKYYKNNFNRLVRVKTKVDPANFFRNEQSIPSISTWWKKGGD